MKRPLIDADADAEPHAASSLEKYTSKATRRSVRVDAKTPSTSTAAGRLDAWVSVKRNSDSSARPRKKARPHSRQSSSYAPPSKYTHLAGIPDTFAPSLILVFIGLNPGLATARAGHAYASPTNHFWKFLHLGGLTPDRQRVPADDLSLPELYSFGNTNLVKRPTKDMAELSKDEMDDAVEGCEEKIRRWKPEAVCFTGKGIWESVVRAKTGKKLAKDWSFGWQDEQEVADFGGARAYVCMSTSGLAASYSMLEKERVWRELGDWVNMRRKERGEEAPKKVDPTHLKKVRKIRTDEWLEALRKDGIEVEINSKGEVKVKERKVTELEDGEE